MPRRTSAFKDTAIIMSSAPRTLGVSGRVSAPVGYGLAPPVSNIASVARGLKTRRTRGAKQRPRSLSAVGVTTPPDVLVSLRDTCGADAAGGRRLLRHGRGHSDTALSRHLSGTGTAAAAAAVSREGDAATRHAQARRPRAAARHPRSRGETPPGRLYQNPACARCAGGNRQVSAGCASPRSWTHPQRAPPHHRGETSKRVRCTKGTTTLSLESLSVWPDESDRPRAAIPHGGRPPSRPTSRPHRRFSTQTECRPCRERRATRPDPWMVSGGCRHPTRRRPHRSRPTAEPGGPRISARRVLKLIRQWLNAGVVEQGRSPLTEVGSPPGGGISPVLANGEYGLAPVG